MGETEQDFFFESKEKFQQQLQDIFQTILRLTGPDQFDQLCQWMEYKQYLTIDDFYESSYNDPEKFDTKGPATEYKWKGKMNHLSPNVAQKLKSFVRWMTHEDRPYELHDDFLATSTRESYLKFRHMDTLSFSASSPSHHEPSKLKTSFSGESKHQTPSESQTALNNFKKGTKRDASVYPIFMNDKYYDTFQWSFLANLKAQGLYDVADPDHDPENGDTYEKELFKRKQSFVYSVLVTSLQTEKGRELVKEFEGDARSIILKLHHYHTKSNVAQHDIITLTKTSPNLILDPPKGQDQPQDWTSDVFVYGRPNPDGSDNPPPMSIINFDDLLGRTFLLPMDENGERKRATISEHVKDLCQQQVSREDQLRFKLKIDGDQLDDLISYNQLMEYLEDKTDTGPLEDGLYRFKCIKDHKGPYTSSDPEYNGSSYNLLIEWEPGEQTWETLSNIIASDPYTCAIYAKEHNLLNTPGWKLLKRHARTARRLIRTLKKSKSRQARASRKYKHGWEVPRDYAHALQLDIHNGNNKWKEAIDLEIEQIKEYQVFKDFGKAVYDKNTITNAPKGHQKIRVHFVFDVKHCGKFKARLVADGHLTKEWRNLRLAMFLAELNNLELWGADVGNAYLQALTREKLYIVGGPEFEELQGHVLVMYKALYGTRSGGACWHDKFFYILHHMGFKPSRADSDIWMKSCKDGSHYEYIAVYVDDLAICMKDPKSFCDTLKEKYKLKLKGVGPINYHLGCGYTRDEDGTLVADPRKYVEKILESYGKTFGEKPKKIKTPLVGGDHPESDISDFCD